LLLSRKNYTKEDFFEMFKVKMFLLFQPSHLGIVWKMELGRRWQTMINVWMWVEKENFFCLSVYMLVFPFFCFSCVFLTWIIFNTYPNSNLRTIILISFSVSVSVYFEISRAPSFLRLFSITFTPLSSRYVSYRLAS